MSVQRKTLSLKVCLVTRVRPSSPFHLLSSLPSSWCVITVCHHCPGLLVRLSIGCSLGHFLFVQIQPTLVNNIWQIEKCYGIWIFVVFSGHSQTVMRAASACHGPWSLAKCGGGGCAGKPKHLDVINDLERLMAPPLGRLGFCEIDSEADVERTFWHGATYFRHFYEEPPTLSHCPLPYR